MRISAQGEVSHYILMQEELFTFVLQKRIIGQIVCSHQVALEPLIYKMIFGIALSSSLCLIYLFIYNSVYIADFIISNCLLCCN